MTILQELAAYLEVPELNQEVTIISSALFLLQQGQLPIELQPLFKKIDDLLLREISAEFRETLENLRALLTLNTETLWDERVKSEWMILESHPSYLPATSPSPSLLSTNGFFPFPTVENWQATQALLGSSELDFKA